MRYCVKDDHVQIDPQVTTLCALCLHDENAALAEKLAKAEIERDAACGFSDMWKSQVDQLEKWKEAAFELNAEVEDERAALAERVRMLEAEVERKGAALRAAEDRIRDMWRPRSEKMMDAGFGNWIVSIRIRRPDGVAWMQDMAVDASLVAASMIPPNKFLGDEGERVLRSVAYNAALSPASPKSEAAK